MPYATLQKVLFFGLLTSVCVPVPAYDFYDVEILVFRQLDSQGDDEELDVGVIVFLFVLPGLWILVNLCIRSYFQNGDPTTLEKPIGTRSNRLKIRHAPHSRQPMVRSYDRSLLA